MDHPATGHEIAREQEWVGALACARPTQPRTMGEARALKDHPDKEKHLVTNTDTNPAKQAANQAINDLHKAITESGMAIAALYEAELRAGLQLDPHEPTADVCSRRLAMQKADHVLRNQIAVFGESIVALYQAEIAESTSQIQ